ncbi:galactokinase [Pseudotenacibaculum sp. MALMAid0570]|uniref:galactokinase n=1 Tax=Pseudotenacibaculum sp. MALMAid0570 TaxID=3143938 RepID=UPI0032DEE0F3
MNKQIVQHITTKYQEQFNAKPILSFAPGRINIIGEHTDYNDGFALPAAIDKGIFAALSITENNLCTVTSLDLEESFQFQLTNLNSIKNGGWKNYVIGVVAEIQKTGKKLSNFNLMISGDIPQGSGLSSSAALENSIVNGLNELLDLKLSKEKMILISQKAEHNYVGVQCGIMDQYASMFGVKGTALLLDCRDLNSTPISIQLHDHSLLLVNSNIQHSLAESAYNNRRKVCEKISKILGIKSLRDANEEQVIKLIDSMNSEDVLKALYVVQENQRVKKAVELLKENNLPELGQLLYQTHKGLKDQYQVSCEELDFLVDFTKNQDSVLGARMMGGGFGGCTLNLIRKDSINQFKNNISKAYLQAFQKECSFYLVHASDGVKIITNNT